MNRAHQLKVLLITLDKLVQSNLVVSRLMINSPLRPGGIQPPPVSDAIKDGGHFTEGGVTRMIYA